VEPLEHLAWCQQFWAKAGAGVLFTIRHPKPVGPLHLDLFSVFAFFLGRAIVRLCAPDVPTILAHHGVVEDVDERGLGQQPHFATKLAVAGFP